MDKHGFLSAINSLKLFSRAELLDEAGRKLISNLYVDPLPDNHVLETILQPTTTFLIGRKGTGKSTIFQRAQESLNTNKRCTWAYIDIKTLYESSTAEIVGTVPLGLENALSGASLHKLHIFKRFIVDLVKEIKDQIFKRINSTLESRIREVFTGSAFELFEKLDEFIEDLESDRYLDATGTMEAKVGTEENKKKKSRLGTQATMGSVLTTKVVAELISELEKKRTQNYSQVYIRLFNIRHLILRLCEILSSLKLSHLYIFVDDFSELPKADMEEVIDTILCPFNNWSDGFIKLKVAVYPGRLYLGNIDRSKIDEVYLDIYRAYGKVDLTVMEDRAIDFTKRLITKRIIYFCACEPSDFMETEQPDFWATLFYSCFANPRILGYILSYCYEENIIYGRKIGIKAIQDAARRYFEEKIGQYFKINRFLHETFDERSSIFSLKELFEEIVKRAKALRTYKDSKLLTQLGGRPPTSHFYISTDYETVLSTLELNFFLTKYYEMKDRDGKESSIYALNFGLCQQQSISFGRPKEKREYRTYFIERIFDYNPLIRSYLKINQEIVCNNCGKKHDPDMLPAIQAFNMLCPECRVGTCKVVNLSRKYENLINEVSADSLLPQTELGILKTLHDERKLMFAKEIAEDLDCSYQLIGKRGKNLADRELVVRDENEKGRRVFQISTSAEKIYFSEEPKAELDYENDFEL